MAEASPVSHPLKSKWFLFYQKVGIPENSFDLIEGDYITTVEEAFSALQSMPDITLLPEQENVFFSRDKVEPKFESFPNGHRVTIFTRSKMQLDMVIPRVMAAVLGEAILSDFSDPAEPKPQAGVIRFTHKPSKVYSEASSIDVWFPPFPNMERVKDYFEELLRTVTGVMMSMRAMDSY